MSHIIGSSELILNSDGSIFHLGLKPQEIAENIILVGDPGRVKLIAEFFSKIELEKQNREFSTITGQYNGKRLTVISTGIGTDNIDIVMNELDALVNIDLVRRQAKDEKKSLNLIRIGTSGALQVDIPVFSFIVSKKSIGFDNLLNFYDLPENFSDNSLIESFKKHTDWNPRLSSPYVVDCDPELFSRIADEHFIPGINISAPGFYGPQGRTLRIKTANPDLNSMIETFSFNGMRITNFEMESSAVYGLSKLLGHHALTVCLAIANRKINNVETGYKRKMEELVQLILNNLTR
jgi:uridine phosphorylase